MRPLAMIAVTISFIFSTFTIWSWQLSLAQGKNKSTSTVGNIWFGLQFICAAYCMIYIFMGGQ